MVNHFVEYVEQVQGTQALNMSSITYNTAMDYVAHRATTPLMPNGGKKFTRAMKEGAAKKTLYFERGVLFQLFREAVKRDIIKKNPFDDVRPKKPTINEVVAAHHPLTLDEEEALLSAAKKFDGARLDKDNPKFHDIVLFLVKTGLRLDEMRCLEWTDITFEDRLIRIREKRVVETRCVRIAEEVVAALTKQLANKSPDDLLFENKDDIAAFGIRLKIRDKDELLAMKVSDVDLENRKIVSTRNYTWKPKGTNGVVPMCGAVRTLLQTMTQTRTSNFVFAHGDGGSCRLDLLDMLKTTQKIAGITGRLRVHDLRHTLAFRLRRAGVHLESIMGVMRHADIKETLIYAPYSIDEGRTAMDVLDKVAGFSDGPKTEVCNAENGSEVHPPFTTCP